MTTLSLLVNYKSCKENSYWWKDIVSNLEGAILNANETWLLDDVKTFQPTLSLPSPTQALSDIGTSNIEIITRSVSKVCLDHIYFTEL